MKRENESLLFNEITVKFLCTVPAVSSVAQRTLSVREVRGSIPAGQIGHRVANDSSPLRRFFGAVLPRR